ncbi:MAG: sarcosine oxidase subunit alpha family protein [Candidatus Pacebacteria bacterium]|nr:sarcosine oxidase subunit alpha family protein [Candidatus Paceibacterota bacterium]
MAYSTKQAYRTNSESRLGKETRTVKFKFDGRRYTGLEGDSLASALLANGVHLVGRSFKYHRPRGIMAAGVEEPNALITLVGRHSTAKSAIRSGRITPNLRATQIELYDGLEAYSQNRFPSLRHDLQAANGWFGRFLVAGFYYKTFKGFGFGLGRVGASFAWSRIYEPLIRRSAGLGKAPRASDPDHYAQFYRHCDVLVVGGGAAGLSAALRAGKAGASVILCDETPHLGGSLLDVENDSVHIDNKYAGQWVKSMVKEIAAIKSITVMTRTQCFGLFADGFAALSQQTGDHVPRNHGQSEGAAASADLPREVLWQVRAKATILATGALERPLVFPNNDRPGVMLASAAEAYLSRYGVAVGRQVVVFTASDSAYGSALTLVGGGVKVTHLIDLREAAAQPRALVDKLREAGVQIIPKASITMVHGKLRVKSIQYRRLDSLGQPQGAELEIPCDTVLMSGGWTPSLHLHSQARGTVRWEEASQNFLPAAPKPHLNFKLVSAGACSGRFGIANALDSGLAAAATALKMVGITDKGGATRPKVVERPISWQGHLGAVPHGHDPRRVKAFVDFQNDVTERDLLIATQEGMKSIEHVKRYTTTGMATDQGKTSNLNGMAIAAEALNRPIPAVGLTTFRMPYTPTSFGIFAGYARGNLFDPIRITPMHRIAVEQGAVFEDVGQWKRAFYFPRAGESMHDAVYRECLTVRQNVGLFDASTLGKIEILGPDSAEFLERFYINPWKKLATGRCRYGILLNEAGFIIDDGVVARIAEDRFHVTTTTGGAARVFAMMEDYLQTEWPELNCWLTSTSEQFAVIAVQGPNARNVLTGLVEGVDLNPTVLPHMGFVQGHICGGIPMRLFRVSFSGELGFEVNIPSAQGPLVMAALLAKVQALKGTVYGTEAMHILRAEKGYIIVGQDTDGTVTPDDAGMAGAIGKNKLDFVGKRSLSRPDMIAPNRKQLVGLLPKEPSLALEDGAQVVAMNNPPAGTPALGHVTSAYYSPILGRNIAMGLVMGGRAKMGETVYIPIGDKTVAAEIVNPVFYDPTGDRVNV